jgi:hypothetical protein
MKIIEYTITQKSGEHYIEFCTRVANEIKTISGKIVKCDFDFRGCECKAILTIEEKI